MKESRRKELRIVERFIEVYCSAHHGTTSGELCGECSDLLEYARERLAKCPHDPKPKCKNCKTHCYSPEYRRKIREVMRYSGMYFVKRGRLDWIVKYYF